MPRKPIKTQQIYFKLKNAIFTLEPGAPLGRTIKELAADYGVGHVTIAAAVKQLQADGLLLAKKKAGLFVHPDRPDTGKVEGWIVFAPSSPDLNPLAEIIRKELKGTNLGLKMWTLEQMKQNEDMFRMGLVKAVVGFFYVSNWGITELVKFCSRYCSNICLFDEYDPAYDSVTWDNEKIGARLGWMLFSNRYYRKILVIGRLSFAQAAFDRENGIRKAGMDLKVHQNRTHWITLESTLEGVEKKIKDLMKAGLEFDAVYAHSLAHVTTIRKLCRSMKRPEPFFVSVGNRGALRHLKTAGIATRVEDMARETARLILARLQDPFKAPQHIQLNGESYYPRQ